MGNRVHVYTVDDLLQSIETNYCGPFQLYFYLNSFEPLERTVAADTTQTPRAPKRKRDYKQLNIKKLDHKLVTQALNEIFSMNTRHNKR